MSEPPWLVLRAAATPDAPALALPERDLTWRELEHEARSIASSFAAQGVRPGDLVATRLGSVAFAPVVHAIWLAGATALPLNARLTASELGFQLRDADTGWLVHDGHDFAHAALAEAPGVHRLYADAQEPRKQLPTFDPQRALAVLFTSGTTGRPKGAELTGANFHASARASETLLGSHPSDRILACMPLFHVGGLALLVRSVLLGSCVRVQEGFDPAAAARALECDGITDVSLVAAMLARVLEARDDAKAPASLRNVLLGGGPIPAPLLRKARERGYPVAPTYGLTECTSQVATRTPGDHAAIGLRPLPGVGVRVDAKEFEEDGEILVRGATVMAGYRNRPEETSRVLRDGWLHTGDVGRKHADGTISVLERWSDLIVSGGENVYPAEIESVLAEHPSVAEVGVAGRPDERYGARPVAWVVPSGSAELDPAALAAFCSERLARFKVPVAFHEANALPRNAAGKLLRAKLR